MLMHVHNFKFYYCLRESEWVKGLNVWAMQKRLYMNIQMKKAVRRNRRRIKERKAKEKESQKEE